MIRGTEMMMRLPLTVFGPIYIGWVYDVTGSYTTAFIQAAVLLTIGTVITAFVRPPKPPVKMGNITDII